MKQVYRLEGLDCANCTNKIENAIAKLKGITSVRLSFLTAKLTIETNSSDIEDLVKALKDIIKKYEPNVIVTPI